MSERVPERWRTLLLAVAIALAGIIAAVGLTLLAALAFAAAGVHPTVTASVVLTIVLTEGLAFAGVALTYVSLRVGDWSFVKIRVPTLRDLGWIVGGYLLVLVLVFVAAFGVQLLGGSPAPNQLSEVGLQNPSLLPLLVPLSLLLVGPGEELLFRGVVQGTLRRSFAPASAVVLSSAIFAGVHFLALTGGTGARLTTIAILFIPSLVFGAAYELTENLTVPILVHGLYDATLAVFLFIGLHGVG